MLDINPLSFIGDLFSTGEAQKWWKLGAGCAVAAFLGFWGGFSTVAGSVIASSHSVSLALAWGFIGGTGLMAAAVAMTVQKQGMWQKLGIVIPKKLEMVLEQTDVAGGQNTQPEKSDPGANVKAPEGVLKGNDLG